MHYAQSCHFVHLHEINVAFTRPLSPPFKPDIQGRQGNVALEKTREPLQMLLVEKLRQTATVIAFTHAAIK
jgi:hypothetical protein